MAKFLRVEKLFEGRHFDREIILLCVRWYLRFKLSFRDLVEVRVSSYHARGETIEANR